LKFSALCAAAIISAAASAASPSVTLESVTRGTSGARPVRIDYKLSGASAVVLLDVMTNGVSIGGANIRRVCGDVGRWIQPGDDTRTILWFPDHDWPGQLTDASAVTYQLTAHPRGREPDYMEVDLCTPSNVTFYASEDSLPFGIESDVYRADRLLMRRIQARGVTWPMGSSTNAAADTGSSNTVGHFPKEKQHEVTLTNDYYIGVFEITQAQWRSMKNKYPNALFTVERDYRPVENTSYNAIRGSGCYWPDPPDESSFLGLLRSFTGMDIDLPGEAQWEYAARAGNYGQRTGVGTVQTYAYGTSLMRFGKSEPESGNTLTTEDGTAAVGSYLPNDWGLYDTLGNVWEFCLDGAVTDITANSHGEIALFADSDMPNSGYLVVRGGCYYSNAYDARPGIRGSTTPGNASNGSRGFRVCYTIPNE